MAEAESVLQERPKMASFISSSVDEAFLNSPTQERENKTHSNCPPPASPVSNLPETSHMTNGSISSPVISSPTATPAKPSTLRKSSGKRKPSKSSKDTNSNHSKKTSRNSPDQSDRQNGECPYSDLDSVPKILCPKALERQPKLVPTQLSVTVVKEVKKQPEIQSGLWFSKSGKERRPKTTSPMPDRTLFSKVSSKKKNQSVVSKKMLVTSVSSSGGTIDHSGSSDKHKTVVPAEANLPPEQPVNMKCKNTVALSRCFGTSGGADPSAQSDKQKSPVSVEASVPSEKCGYSKCSQTSSNSADAVISSVSDRFGSTECKKTPDPGVKVSFNDQPRFSESAKGVSQTEHPEITVNKKVHALDRISKQVEEQQSGKSPVSILNSDTSDSLATLEKQTSLVSKCRLPFVKLIRKDIKGKKCLKSSLTMSPTERTKKEKTLENSIAKISSKQSEWVDSEASVPSNQTFKSGSIKVSVLKLKASDGNGMLRLSSESSQGETGVTSTEAGSPGEEERIPGSSPSNMTSTSSDQSDHSQSESKKTPASDPTGLSSDQSAQSATSVSTSSHNTVQPSHQQKDSVPRKPHVSKGPSSEKSKKVIRKSKPVPIDVDKVIREQPAHLPASNRLMTRALKALQEAEQRKQGKAQKEAGLKEPLNPFKKAKDLVCHSATNSNWTVETKLDICTKTKSPKSHYKNNSEYDKDTLSSCSSPPLMLSDSTDIETDVKSEDEDLSISSTPPMDFIPLTSKVKAKKEDQSADICSSSSPSSPFSFINDFKNVEQVSFQSVTNESDGKPVSFKADSNYKFSTFLMMLKDLHDTREREGTPLELEIGPPSAHVKEEPLVMPGEIKPPGQDPQIDVNKNSNSSPDKIIITHRDESTSQMLKRPYNRRGSCTGGKKKANRKVPCRPVRSGPGFPGLGSLPTVDSSTQVDCSSRVQSLLGLQASSWERQAGGGEGVVHNQEEEQEGRWSRLNQNLQNMVPLEARAPDTALCLGRPNGLVADCTETNASLMHNVGGRDKTQTGKNRVCPL